GGRREGCGWAQARPGAGLPWGGENRQPVLSIGGWETCRLSPRLQGVGRLSGGCQYGRVSSPRLPGEHLSREAAPCADAFFAEDSGVAAGCEIVGGSAGIRQPACVSGLGAMAPFACGGGGGRPRGGPPGPGCA